MDMCVKAFAAAALAAFCCRAEVKPGENILRNGRFECDQMESPPFWTRSSSLEPGRTLVCLPSDGPGGLPALRIVNDGTNAKPLTCTLRQQEITLVPGGRYRMAAKVRTKNLGKKCSFMVINTGWKNSVDLSLPRNSPDWTEVSREVVMMSSGSVRQYGAVFYAPGFTGQIEIADFRLEALSADACAGSSPAPSTGDPYRLRLVPWRPLLCAIPADTRRVTFKLFGRLPPGKTHGDCDVVVGTDDASEQVRVPLAASENELTLPAGAKTGLMTVRVVVCATGENLTEDSYRFHVVPPMEQGVEKGRTLNNLVTELLDVQVASDDWRTSVVVGREAWLYLAVTGRPNARVELDGAEVIGATALNGETFRFVSAGRHDLRVREAAGARAVVRRVPELFNYPACVSSYVSGNPPYDWDFFERHVFPATTTQNGGTIPPQHRPLFRARGGRWLANLGTTSITNGNDLIQRLESSVGMTQPYSDGVTCDEQFFFRSGALAHYTEGLKRFNATHAGDKLIYTWIVGKPAVSGLDQEFAAACLNASRGRGRLISEIYCRTKATEELARESLNEYLVGTMKMFAGLYPDAPAHCGIILGDFVQIPVISLVHHPEVDYKYFLDMQLNMIANDPAFRGLGCTGYWGSYYADEETFRWAMALLRHYGVEGRRTMLSERYGFRYLPGHLVNGDFRGSLDGWRTKGDVRTDRVAGLGAGSEKRWGGASGLGDTFAVLTKTNGVVAAVEQTVHGLVPGRRYCLQACLFDAVDAHEGKMRPHKVPLTVTVDGGTVDGARCWRHAKGPRGKSKKKKNGVSVNLEHIVFTATGPDAVVKVANDAAPEGRALGVNCVSLNPYFAD